MLLTPVWGCSAASAMVICELRRVSELGNKPFSSQNLSYSLWFNCDKRNLTKVGVKVVQMSRTAARGPSLDGVLRPFSKFNFYWSPNIFNNIGVRAFVLAK